MTPPWAKCGLWAAGWLVAGGLVSQVEPLRYEGGRSRDEEGRAVRNHSALAAMLGEFRTSASDLMFMQTERYLHGGVSFRKGTAHASEEERDEHAHGLAQEHGEEHAHGRGHDAACSCQGEETAIPRRERDFRGWVGDLYRQVKPWRDPSEPHVHTDGRELLPWFRLMTTSDPRYVQGYLAGAFWLQKEDPAQALRFVEEGVRNNPEAFQLYVSRGLIRMKQVQGSGDEALSESDRSVIRSSRDDFARAAELGLARRPAEVEADGTHGAEWVTYQENDLLAACRMAVLLSERLGDEEAAQRHRERFAPMLEEENR